LKIVTYSTNGGSTGVGKVEDGQIVPLGVTSVQEYMDRGHGAFDAGEAVPLAEARLHAPVPRPQKIVCIGLNYRDHAEETGQPIPDRPIVFAKFPNGLVGHGEPIVVPPITEQADYEAELAVVVGRRARNVPEPEALGHVFGYANANDVSARDVQLGEGGQWTRGKAIDTFCPMGPCVVTRDEVPDPQDLPVRCVLNGEVVQDGHTSRMIFPVAELVSFLSTGMTLEPGDVILTGTPPGVGMARDPQLFLKDGDEVTVEIGGLGRLTNPVVAKG